MDELLTIEDLVKDRSINALRVFEHRSDPNVPYILPTLCPFSNKPLVTPAKGLNCNHIASIELKELLTYIKSSKKWECPLCFKPMPYYQIYVDSTAKQIFLKLRMKYHNQQIDRLEVHANGKWKLFNEDSAGADPNRTQGITAYFQVKIAEPNPEMDPSTLLDAKTSPGFFIGFPKFLGEVMFFSIESHEWIPLVNYQNLVQHSNFTLLYVEACECYVIGGINSEFQQVSTVYRFGLLEGLLQVSPMLTPRSHFSVNYREGFLYVFGGISGNMVLEDCEKYDISNNEWTPIASIPIPRYGHVSSFVNNVDILILGGVSQDAASIYKYDSFYNNWSLINSRLPTPVLQPFLHYFDEKSQILLFGGGEKQSNSKFKSSKNVQVLDLDHFTWSVHENQLPIYTGEATMPCIVERTGKVHIITGIEEGHHIVYDLKKQSMQDVKPTIVQIVTPEEPARPAEKKTLFEGLFGKKPQ